MQSDEQFYHDSCPVDSDTKKWIDARSSWLVDQFGTQWIRQCEVILPTAEFFPKTFRESEEDVRKLLDDICGYMKLNPCEVELEIYDESHRNDGRSSTGDYHHDGNSHIVGIEASMLGDPPGLAATMAHELCHVHLLGHGRLSPKEDDHEPLTDLLTVFLGLGVITANDALKEVNWRVGNLEGWQMGRRGYFTMPIFGYALALFAIVRDEFDSPWAKHLRLDVRDAFRKSLRYFDNYGAPDLRFVKSTTARPTLVLLDAYDEVEEPFDELSSDSEDGEAACVYCGQPLPNDVDAVCDLCQESIEENDRELEFERQRDVSKTQWSQRVFRYVFLMIAIAILVAAILEWLGVIS